jgi:RHS repeat-associated protein
MDLLRSNGATTNKTPDNALRLGSFTQNFSGTVNDLTNSFLYNPASQTTTLYQSNSLYVYSEQGSRTGTYVPNGLNQYSSIGGGTPTYDANGNLTNDGASPSTNYTYDMENHLVGTSGTTISSLAYDVLGRLSQFTVNGTTTTFHYDGDALVGEYVNNLLTRRYVHGDQVDEPLLQYNSTAVGAAARRYLHSDQLGSIIAQSDNVGALIANTKNTYDAYGVPGSSNGDRFGYTGQTWLKDIGLNYYKARIYSPRLGRFLQTDQIFYRDDFNLYAYVGGDPVDRTDPTGTVCETRPHSAKTCRVDWMKDTNGTTTRRRDFTAAQQKSVEKFEAKYTQTVRRLDEKAATGASVELIGPNGQKMTVEASKVAGELSSTEVTVDLNSKEYMKAHPGSLTVGPAGLAPPPRLYGLSGKSIDFLYGIALTHEAIHGAYYWSGNMWKGESETDFNRHHQEPFNKASDELLK